MISFEGSECDKMSTDLKMTVPFTDDFVIATRSHLLTVTVNNRNSPFFDEAGTPCPSGGTMICNIRAEGGIMYADINGKTYEFNGLETRNGAVYAVGYPLETESRDGFVRFAMNRYVPLSDAGGYGICISSHVDYCDKALPVAIDSIRKAGIDMSKVVSVVGGYDGEKEERESGSSVLFVKRNGIGFGGLLGADQNYKYWIMMHDTCEVAKDFLAGGIPSADVGLNPDIISIVRGLAVGGGIGIYSTEFIKSISGWIGDRSLPDRLVRESRVITAMRGTLSVSNTKKDVYGTGHRRSQESLGTSKIIKFRGQRGRRGP
jgi:hypothetical protein